MDFEMRSIYYHAHEGPPYRCHGGTLRRDLCQDLVGACIEVGYPTTRLVESLDPVETCCYRDKKDVMLVGYES